MGFDDIRGFEEEWEVDLNIDFSRYAREIVSNEDFYAEEGLSAYQMQNSLEAAPKASEVGQDLDLMAEVGLLEKEEVGSSKRPDIYHLKVEDERSAVREYTDSALGWADEYVDILRERLTHPM